MTRHQVETELSDIRREIIQLKRREALLVDRTPEDMGLPRPGWPMHRAGGSVVQPFGLMISASEPARTAV